MIKTLSVCTVIIFVTLTLLIFMPDNSNLFDPSYYYETLESAKKLVVATVPWQDDVELNEIWNEDTGRYEVQAAPTPDGGEADYPPPANAYFPLLDQRNSAYLIYNHPDAGLTTTSNAPPPAGKLGYMSLSGAHRGVDIGTVNKDGNLYQDIVQPNSYDTVHAVKEGVVVTVEDTKKDGLGTPGSGYGYHIIFVHKDGTFTLYGHMVRNSGRVKAGDSVKAGQVIGLQGNTGASNPKHLHLETRSTGRALDLSKATTYRGTFYNSTAVMYSTYITALRVAADSGVTKYKMSSIQKDEIPQDLWAVYGIS